MNETLKPTPEQNSEVPTTEWDNLANVESPANDSAEVAETVVETTTESLPPVLDVEEHIAKVVGTNRDDGAPRQESLPPILDEPGESTPGPYFEDFQAELTEGNDFELPEGDLPPIIDVDNNIDIPAPEVPGETPEETPDETTPEPPEPLPGDVL